MNTTMSLIILAVLFVIVLLIVYAFMSKTNTEKERSIQRLTEQNAFLMQELNQERSLLAQSNTQILQLERDVATLSTNLGNLHERYEESIESQSETKEKFLQLATKVLDQKTRQFDEDHKR